MAKSYPMTQCRLKKGNTETVSWIPTKFAKKGKYLKLKNNRTNEWEDGWQVISNSDGHSMPSEIVLERSQDYKYQRQASDV